MDDIIATPQVGQGIARLIDRAFLTAHLLTGSLQQAEETTLEAIDSWNPCEDPEDVLFENVLDAALRAPVEPKSGNVDAPGSYLPDRLMTVLRLAPYLRGCFVLRILAGLPIERCAQLLGLHSDLIDRYTSEALQRLSPAQRS
jgi:DNA-directed RNA polymerase specialized sigma24 family protein